ncbi:MAG: hypothetical protein IKW63_02735 [Elusimicrobiaceae bacterium]|nr:hypothetical protein [Elusimicrobiaceae bacterium]
MSQVNIKTFIEQQHFRYFLENEIGKQFIRNLQTIQILKSEKPDFLLCSAQGMVYGFEVTTLDAKTSNEHFFKSLDSVVKKLFIKISNQLNRQYFVNIICLEKNWHSVQFKSADLVQKLFEVIQKDDGKESDKNLTYSLGGISVTGKHKTTQITTNGVRFQMIYSVSDKNFGGSPIFGNSIHNPIVQIQELITRKNIRVRSYLPCVQQFLMIVVDPFITKGCFFTFDNALLNHTFISDFSKVFLLILGGRKNIEVMELKNAKK